MPKSSLEDNFGFKRRKSERCCHIFILWLLLIWFNGFATPHRSTDDRSPALPTIPFHRDSFRWAVESRHYQIINHTKGLIIHIINRSKHYQNICHLFTNLGDIITWNLCTLFCVIQGRHFWGLSRCSGRAECTNRGGKAKINKARIQILR